MPRRRRRGSGKRRPRTGRAPEDRRHGKTSHVADEREALGYERSAHSDSAVATRSALPPARRRSAPATGPRPASAPLRAVARFASRLASGKRPAQRPPAERSRDADGPSPRLALARVALCSALCAAGMVFGTPAVLHEISFHIASPPTWYLCAGVALGLGMTGGLWLPRRFLQRKSPPSGAPGTCLLQPDRPRVELDFAASLAGTLIVVLGGVWLALSAVALGLESWRALVVRNSLLPAPLIHGVILAPLLVLLALAGATFAAGFVALRGWARLLPNVSHRLGWLSLATVAGMVVAAALLPRAAAPPLRLAAAVVPFFAAAALAVCRRTPGIGRVPRLLPAIPVTESVAITITAVAAAAVGLAALMALGYAAPHGDDFLNAWLVAGVGVLAGALLTVPLSHRPHPVLAPLALLVGAAGWSFAAAIEASPATAHLTRLFVSAATATLAVGLLGPRLAVACGSAQDAFVRQALVVSATLTVTLLITVGLKIPTAPGTIAVVAALSLTSVAAWALLFDRSIRALPRSAGLGAVALTLALMFAWGRFNAPAGIASPDRSAAAPASAAAHAAHALYNRSASRDTACPTVCATSAVDARDHLNIDLGGRRLPLAVVRLPNNTALDDPLQRELLGRLLRRCRGALLPGGYLAMEPCSPNAVRSLLDALPPAAQRSARLLRVETAHGNHSVLVSGPNVPAWIRSHSWPAHVRWSLSDPRHSEPRVAAQRLAQP